MEKARVQKVKLPPAGNDADGNLIDVADFLSLVVSVSRFIYNLARIQPFQNASLGLAEWAALSLLAQNEAISARQLGQLLGVPPPRVEQLKSSLRQASLISEPLSSTDPTVIVTRRGKLHLEDMNAALKLLLDKALKHRPHTLTNAKKHIDSVMRIVAMGREQRPKQKATPPQAARKPARH